MTYADWLIHRIHRCLEKGKPIPIDLFTEAMGAGLDVSEIETKFLKEQE